MCFSSSYSSLKKVVVVLVETRYSQVRKKMIEREIERNWVRREEREWHLTLKGALALALARHAETNNIVGQPMPTLAPNEQRNRNTSPRDSESKKEKSCLKLFANSSQLKPSTMKLERVCRDLERERRKPNWKEDHTKKWERGRKTGSKWTIDETREREIHFKADM